MNQNSLIFRFWNVQKCLLPDDKLKQVNRLCFKLVWIQIQNSIEKEMLKKKSTSKKKKFSTPQTPFLLNAQKHAKPTHIATYLPSKPHYHVHKHPKPTHSYTPTVTSKPTKLLNKENMSHSIFHSCKNSYIITPMGWEEDEGFQRRIRRRNDYRFIFQIGSGGFGQVWKVEEKRDRKVYAMKEMSKAKIIMKKSVGSVINQKELLEELNCPFIINSHISFQDRENLYLVMEYLRGGDLRYHLCFYEYFSEQQTKFIIACIVLAMEYVHARKIIHRDLKPENIVFEENGYVHITDFGVARKYREANSQETSGTPGYMAPEVICRMNHSFEVDFFALGVIAYEMMLGIRPYMGDSRKEIREKILAHQARIYDFELPPGWSVSALDFVNRLLKRNKENRLGYRGIHQIKSHEWLSSINWLKLSKKELIPPFCPGIICETPEYQKQMQNSIQSQIDEDVLTLIRKEQIQKLFRSYEPKQKNRYLKSNKRMYNL